MLQDFINDSGLTNTTVAQERDDPTPFTTRHYPLSVELPQSSPFRDVLSVWNSRRIGAEPPAWDAFEFSDFRGWHSRMIVSVFADEEPDPVFRIMGEDWRHTSFGNVTGMRFSELLPKLYGSQFRDHLRTIREQALIGHASGQAAQEGRDFLNIQVLELPVSRNGERVGGLLHCIHFDT
jgi:hypothetical protein